MRRIKENYKKKRAEIILDMREKGMSYNKISWALNGSITPQRVKQIVDHYQNRIKPYLEDQKNKFLEELKS